MLLHRQSSWRLGHRWRVLAFTAACGAVSMTVACARVSPAQSAPPVGAASQLYERACARCHAADGSGGLPMVAGGPRPIDLRSADWQVARSDEEVYAAIRDGRGAMPPFLDVLSADEIAALTVYVRQLGTSAPSSR